ncbi:MAG: glycosyltransferase [Armatimonadota bacterium]|nr:glycosyltransferase [Armatimonadota bacterium]MDW8291301.1 glycosyltransferase [Armatimonadota bacterium]
MTVAVVHDYLNQRGGAEKVLNALLKLLPAATVYTSVVQRAVQAECVPESVPVRSSFLQRLPLAVSQTRLYLPLLPLAFERMSLRGSDLVLSISSAFAKGVRVPADVPHLCYCQTPMRFAWNLDGYLRYERVSLCTRAAVRWLMTRFRQWDVETASRVTEFVAISCTVQERIRRFYGRDARVIYPPVDTAQYHPAPAQEKGDYYLVLSRLLPYKRIDVAVEACNRLRLPLVVAGEGRDAPRLSQLAGPTVQMVGRVSDQEARRLLARARALILVAEEDFGLTPVEAMASGTPVIAYRAGGATESVVEGATGMFFDKQEPETLIEALRRFDPSGYDPQRCVERAKRFDLHRFYDEWRQVLQQYGYTSLPKVQVEREAAGL